MKSLPRHSFLALTTLTLALGLAAASCSSAPKEAERPEPAWVHEPARRVDGGYIIYVGSGDDTTLERAHFKATSMALQDLVNECSLASKGTRVEDTYDHPEGAHQFRVYAKVAIEFQDCESAKQAVLPDEVRKLASIPLTQQLKRYQEMIDEPMPEALASADEGDTDGVNPMVNGGYTSSPSYSSGPWRTRLVVINSPDSYFWMRQQVAYDKQVVILAPPTQYQAGTLQTQTYVQSVKPAATQIQSFEKKNPETRTWNKSYSQSPVRQARLLQFHQAKAQANAAKAPRFRPEKRGQGKVQGQVAKPARGRRKKRWN